MTRYPLHLDLTGRRAVVVGAGPVAARRARDLVAAGADVLVVAPEACTEVVELAGRGRVRWQRSRWAPEDLDGAWLVHTATGDAGVDEAVALAAQERRTWCVRASDGSRSPAWTPSVVRREDVVVSVTAGRDPRRAAAISGALAAHLDTGGAPLRRRRPGPGRVVLVGGGPGSPDLLTLRGRRALAEADVVVTDRLGPVEVLDELDADVEVVDVGKAPDHHAVPQEEINRILVERALAGARVVRLKGGDPYVFGRGGEELAACRAAGVECEVVPGVTSALAVPAAAGIPVTHRGLSRSVTVLTGHEALDPPVHAALAALGGTLVVLMGVSRLGHLCAGLVGAGAPASTPVAVVERGWTPEQRTTTATLASAARVAAESGVRAPAVVVIGAVAAMADGA